MAKIMIVDDSTADLRFMNEILIRTPHSVSQISNPLEVEARVASEQPDLLLLDVVMPERNGYEVLRALKKPAMCDAAQTARLNEKLLWVLPAWHPSTSRR